MHDLAVHVNTPASQSALAHSPQLDIARLGCILSGTPPCLVPAIPLDGGLQALRIVGALGLPSQAPPQPGGADRVPVIVVGTVAYPVEVVPRPVHRPQDVTQHGDVIALAVDADEVGPAKAPTRKDLPYGARTVVKVNTVADNQRPRTKR